MNERACARALGSNKDSMCQSDSRTLPRQSSGTIGGGVRTFAGSSPERSPRYLGRMVLFYTNLCAPQVLHPRATWARIAPSARGWTG